MTLIADLFPKLRIPENVVRYMSKKSRFKGPFDTQHGKRVHWNVIESEKVCFSQTQSLITVC